MKLENEHLSLAELWELAKEQRHLLTRRPVEEPRLYYLGWFKVAKGYRFYCVKDKNKIPTTSLGYESKFIKPSEVQKILSEYTNKSPMMGLLAGQVVYCSDSDKTHTAILLEPNTIECKVLYFTSNDRWSKFARLATLEEIALCGMPQKNITFLAPTIVERKYIYHSGIIYPSERLSKLIQEFLFDKQCY